MALKWLFFQKKISRIAQWLGASPPSPHTCHYVQNVSQMALKSLFFSKKKIAKIAQLGPNSGNLFSRTQSSQTTICKIIITKFFNKQML